MSAIVIISLFTLTLGAITTASLWLGKHRLRIDSPATQTVLYGVKTAHIGQGLLVAVGDDKGCYGVVEASPHNNVRDVISAIGLTTDLQPVVLNQADLEELYDWNKSIPLNETLEEVGIADGDTLFTFAYNAGGGGNLDDRVTEVAIYRILENTSEVTMPISKLSERLDVEGVELSKSLEHYLKILEEDNLVLRDGDNLRICQSNAQNIEVSFRQPMVVGDDNVLDIVAVSRKFGTAIPKEQIGALVKDLYLLDGYIEVVMPYPNEHLGQFQIIPECSDADIHPTQRDVLLTGSWRTESDVDGEPIRFILSFKKPGRKILRLKFAQGKRRLKASDVEIQVVQSAFKIGSVMISERQYKAIQLIFGLISALSALTALFAK